ncbi:single-stranded-DNA-specific exonuclease RecJ [Vicingus serpentipes]|uniref:Single-stranded-DNA-specific exonuclease RecJ n=1 Tax=Vicingus serpentipes TaxID=1926625 RepID=A0A5C6RNG8_9FLAO|nr:single-stranded-DNA-specific exonuclease RecJ [Vicingus serpentipes]TXB63958.1 single-stranded-DNA-specific exonuclease RecJ [Vicingus serpentipes]
MEKRWQINEQANESETKKLSESLNNLDLTLTNILLQRGIDTFDKAKSFFRPSLDEIHDPFLMKDMDKAVSRLQQAIENNEKILVFGDYDVDGTTSVALVYSYLKNYYQNLEYYIPDRYTEGYGISYQGIDYAAENNFKLIIALDCGIKAIEKVDYASEKGVDFIICDHHRPGDTIPNAVAVLDQKREDCNYPYKELSGCGVGFKLMQAWTKQTKKEEAKLFEYLDLLAISTCADIVPITGENRVFVYYGLKVINENPRLGVKTLIDLANKKKDLTSTDVVFTIAPRINAAGRIETGNKAVEMLVEENKTSALGFGKNINELNTDRKDLDRDITAEALAMIAENTSLQTKKTTVLFQENWHKGVIGIVASRLIETHYRPTIILTESNGKATGSARSVKDFDVYNAIDACSDLLEQFGGHKYAAGLTMKLENLDAFIEKFEEVVNEQIDDELLIPQVTIDAKLELNQINDKFYSILKQFAPTGPSNMRPVFMSENVFSTQNSRIVGENHLKLEVFQEENPDLKFACIGFNLGHLLDEIAEGVPFSIVYNIEENTWNGNTTLQLSIKDLKV